MCLQSVASDTFLSSDYIMVTLGHNWQVHSMDVLPAAACTQHYVTPGVMVDISNFIPQQDG